MIAARISGAFMVAAALCAVVIVAAPFATVAGADKATIYAAFAAAFLAAPAFAIVAMIAGEFEV